jgi:hypothetical protein
MNHAERLVARGPSLGAENKRQHRHTSPENLPLGKLIGLHGRTALQALPGL